MEAWALVRFIHLLGVAVFAGGQVVLAAAVLPAARAAGVDPDAVRGIAKRFGMLSAIALTAIVATGIAMASHYSRWDDPELHAKIGLLVVVAVLTGAHVRLSHVRGVSLAMLALTLGIVWFGVALAHTA